jgi:glycosyltransferase involved in cell wall biosynthesis
MKKKISIVTPVLNELQNIENFIFKVREEMEKLDYEYEHIIIDNFSDDGTVEVLRKIAKSDSKLKIILNSRNFGSVRSPFYGLLQATGDAVILINADFQDPIDLIPQYIEKWQEGNDIVLNEKFNSDENKTIFLIRKLFYSFISKISEVSLKKNITGSGIYDKKVIERLKLVNDPYPYLRGLIFELGFKIDTIKFNQPVRLKGKSKHNFFSMYDIAMLGIVKHSKLPLRLMTMFGFLLSFISILVGLFYFFYKLFFWNSFSPGVAPLVIGLFLLGAVQVFLIGLLGEYISVILLHSRNQPLVEERERINFE